MPFHHTVLPNGLTLIGESNPQARSVALGFFVKTGARDETPEVSGVTHFLEHMIFKGTPRRTALQVNEDFDRIGANYNAYTSEENTVFHASILPEYLPQAVDILADILRPSLREEDFDMEKKVIIEEIGMYDDQPMWATYDVAKQTFFGDHPLGKSVLGTKESIGQLQCAQMRDYFQRRYVSSNIVVVATGRIEWPDLVRMIETHCAPWPDQPTQRALPPGPKTRAFKLIQKPTVHQEHCFLLSQGPDAKSPLRYAAEILATAIGDDTGSRIYWALIDPGLVEAADFSVHEYAGTGAYYGYFCGEPDSTTPCLDIYLNLLREVQKDGLTEAEIRTTKSKLASRIVRGNERPMGRMQALGFQWTYLGQYRTVDDDLASIDSVTSDHIRELLDVHPIDEPTIVALGPLEKMTAPYNES